jgi:pyruvate carboxylase
MMFTSLAVVDAGPLTRRVAVAAHEIGIVTTLVSAADPVREALDAGVEVVHVLDADAATQLAVARACAATGLGFVGASVEALATVVDPDRWTEVAQEVDVEVCDPGDGRRIDVQVLADSSGDVVHLREREVTGGDDSVVMAPAPRLATAERNGLCRDAVRLVAALGLVGAVTVRFEVDEELYAVTDVLPGLQLGHTATEEVTNLDLVQAQLHLAHGARLVDLGLTQDSIIVRGYAISCRVTADAGRSGVRWRVPGGPGVRIDGETGGASGPASRLVAAMTFRGRDLVHTMRRTRRALTELEADGATNLPELQHALARQP